MTVKNPRSKTLTENLSDSCSTAALSKDLENNIINSISDGLFVLDRDLRINFVNQTAIDLTKYAREELLGNSLDVLLAGDQSFDPSKIEDLQKNGRSLRQELYIKTKDQESVIVVFSVSSVSSAEDSSGNFVCLMRDVTERKKIELDLQRENEQYKDLFENAPVPYHELDMEGRFARINKAEELLLGYTDEELKGRFPWEIIVEQVSRGAIAAKLSGEVPLKPVERTFICKDGHQVSVVNEDRLIQDPKTGKVTGIRSALHDITERKQAESDSRIISEIIHGVITTANLDELLLLIHQSIGKVLDAENCFMAIYDPHTEQFNMQFFVDKEDSDLPVLKLGRGLTGYIFRKDQAMLLTNEMIHQLTETGEIELVGTPPAVWLGVPLRLANQTIGVLVVQHYENKDAYNQSHVERLTAIADQISLAIECKQSADQLKIFNEKLQQSNRELQDFAYVASHDLQEPLRKIQAFGDRLERKYAGALNEEGCDYLQRMRHAAKRMQILIEDLLTFSRVSTKSQPFAQVSLGDITRDVLSDLEIRIEQTGATVQIDALPTLDADPLQMRQLMQNLVGNALKFSQPDVPPVIKISGNFSTSQTANIPGNLCQITVQDNGIGFEEKYTDRIFTVFQRLHGRGEFEGSGVGLAVCRKIVERHNGHITAKSAVGQGATFIITLPVRQIEAVIN
jgi:PAS domain S-box-containing protein